MIKVNRIPNDNVYDIFLTFVLGFTIITIIYALTPSKHCSIYFTKNKIK
jgi:hypothetical protein